MKRIYISGKIGEEELSSATIQKFRDAESALLLRFDVFNPCDERWQRTLRREYEHDSLVQSPWLTAKFPDFYSYALLRDMMVISTLDAICLLPDWRQSKGARAELAFAQATGKKIYELNEYGTLIEWEDTSSQP